MYSEALDPPNGFAASVGGGQTGNNLAGNAEDNNSNDDTNEDDSTRLGEYVWAVIGESKIYSNDLQLWVHTFFSFLIKKFKARLLQLSQCPQF